MSTLQIARAFAAAEVGGAVGVDDAEAAAVAATAVDTANALVVAAAGVVVLYMLLRREGEGIIAVWGEECAVWF